MVVKLPKQDGSQRFDEAWREAKVLPRQMLTAPIDLSKWKERLDGAEMLQCREYGSRRASALALAMNVERSLCVVVSADGPIYVMTQNGKPMSIERFPKAE